MPHFSELTDQSANRCSDIRWSCPYISLRKCSRPCSFTQAVKYVINTGTVFLRFTHRSLPAFIAFLIFVSVQAVSLLSKCFASLKGSLTLMQP